MQMLVLDAAKERGGKTTLSGASLCPRGPVVAVIDLASQGGLTAWWTPARQRHKAS